MVPQMPYIRNMTFTLMGVPKVEISAIPMSKALPNVLDLPLISGFVQSSIAAAANEYVAPKSMTLNMARESLACGRSLMRCYANAVMYSVLQRC